MAMLVTLSGRPATLLVPVLEKLCSETFLITVLTLCFRSFVGWKVFIIDSSTSFRPKQVGALPPLNIVLSDDEASLAGAFKVWINLPVSARCEW